MTVQSFGLAGFAKPVIMNNRIMSATYDITHEGVVSLYNNGFFPKKGGTVTRRSNFFKGSQTQKLYQTAGEHGVPERDGFISPEGTRRTTIEGMSIHHGRHTLQEASMTGQEAQMHLHFEVALDRNQVQDFL